MCKWVLRLNRYVVVDEDAFAWRAAWAQMKEKQNWSETRSRGRVAEIVAFSDRIQADLAAVLPGAAESQASGPVQLQPVHEAGRAA